jgi:hypothetical protein
MIARVPFHEGSLTRRAQVGRHHRLCVARSHVEPTMTASDRLPRSLQRPKVVRQHRWAQAGVLS